VSAAQEFCLLELFMSYPGRVWSRQQLFEQVWGPDFAGIPKNVDVHSLAEGETRATSKATQIHRHGAEVGYRFG